MPPSDADRPPPVPPPPVADPPKLSILARTTRGAGWIFAFRLFTRVLGTFSNIILAALLLPADFGIWTLGTASMQMVETLSYVGVEDALVREKAPDRAMYNTGFTLNLLRGLLVGAVMALAAYPVSLFYQQPALLPVLLILGLGSVIEAAGNIGMVDYRRSFEFDREFFWLAVPRVLQVLTMIVVAVLTRSYVALLAGIMVARVVKWVMGYVLHPFRPRLSLASWRHLLGFSAWTWVVSMAVLLRDQAPKAVIGFMLPAKILGMFGFGMDLAGMPITELVAPMSRSAFSGFSVGRHEGESGGETYLRIVSFIAVFTVPVGVGLSLVADPLVRLALGTEWLGTVPLISIVSLLSSFAVYGYLGWTLFFAHGRLKLVFVITATGALLRLLLLYLLLPRLELVGAALAVFLTSMLEDLAYIVLVRIYFAARFSVLWARNWRFLFAALLMAVVLYAAGLGWVPVVADRLTLSLHLLLVVPLGAALYAGTLVATWMLSGRPDGTEADLLRLIAGRLARVRR